jgi:chromosome segregation ATPase
MRATGALADVQRGVANLAHEKSALEELREQLRVDEGSLNSLIAVVSAECERLSQQLADAARHVDDVDAQIAAAAHDDALATAEVESMRRHLREIDGEAAALEGEIRSYRDQVARARGVFDVTLDRTLRMGHKLRHGADHGGSSAIGTSEVYGEDEW